MKDASRIVCSCDTVLHSFRTKSLLLLSTRGVFPHPAGTHIGPTCETLLHLHCTRFFASRLSYPRLFKPPSAAALGAATAG